MRKLLRANIFRLFRDKVFLISLALMIIAGIGLPVIHYIDNCNNNSGWTPDTGFLSCAFFVFILISIFTALFLGSEYSDGTMRNKLTVGHKRSSIYIANLIVCITAGIIMCLSYIIPYLCVSIPLLGAFDHSVKDIVMLVALVFALIIALAAIFTLVAMLCHNKAYTAAACILLAFAMLFAGIRIVSALNEPEYYDGYSYTENGVTVSEDKERNPNYLSGTKRQVYEFLNDFTPGGQALQLANMEAENPLLLVLYNGIIIVLATGCGMVLFKRKDLK